MRPKAAKAKKQNKAALLMRGGDAPAAAVVDIVPGVRLGYAGEAKGFLDVLFERGWLDPAVKYTIKGPKLPDGTRDESKSLATIMAMCEDFRNEATAMHELMGLLGVEMGQTPKGHPELAGRGIEFFWGKGKYLPPHQQVLLHEAHLREDSPRGAEVGDFAALSPVSAQGRRLQACVPLADGRGLGPMRWPRTQTLRSCASSPRRTAALLTRTACLLRARNLLVLSMLV